MEQYKRVAYLEYVQAEKNSNKFYIIMEQQNNSIDTMYGRTGKTMCSYHYDDKTFEALYKQKISKGYVDKTSNHIEEISAMTSGKKEELSYKEIDNKEINGLVTDLIESARAFMKFNYAVSITDINKKQVQEAENDINILKTIAYSNRTEHPSQLQLYEFNLALENLFLDIPRDMNKVSDFMAKSTADFDLIIQREEDMLNNIKSQLKDKEIEKELPTKDITVLERYGVKIDPVTYKEEDNIISHLGNDYDKRNLENRYVTSYKVTNLETQKQFEQFKKDYKINESDVKQFYHGSKVENWWSIMKEGLNLNPDARTTGKMFGKGLYFAGENECRKSLNYMDVKGSVWNDGTRGSGYVAIYDVALGKSYKPTHSLSSDFNFKDLKGGCLSVYADKHLTGLQNDEYVIYKQEQCTIKYLVEMKSRFARTKEYNLDRDKVSLNNGLDEIIKIPEGYKIPVDLQNLSDSTYNQLKQNLPELEVTSSMDIMYDKQTDYISFNIETSSDGYNTTGLFTNDDLSFLRREVKKAFVESEYEWKQLVSLSDKVKTENLVIKKGESQEDVKGRIENDNKPEKKDKKNKNVIEK